VLPPAFAVTEESKSHLLPPCHCRLGTSRRISCPHLPTHTPGPLRVRGVKAFFYARSGCILWRRRQPSTCPRPSHRLPLPLEQGLGVRSRRDRGLHRRRAPCLPTIRRPCQVPRPSHPCAPLPRLEMALATKRDLLWHHIQHHLYAKSWTLSRPKPMVCMPNLHALYCARPPPKCFVVTVVLDAAQRGATNSTSACRCRPRRTRRTARCRMTPLTLS